MRIFLGLYEIAGYYTNLAQGFQDLGHQVTYINLFNSQHKYAEVRRQPKIVKLLEHASWKRMDAIRKSSGILPQGALWICEFILRIVVMSWLLCTHDVFIYSFGTTFFRYYELPLLRFLRKKIVYVFHGSDSRPPYLDGVLMASNSGRSIEACVLLAKKTKKRICKIESYADFILQHPPQAVFHERPFILALAIGIPFIKDKVTSTNNMPTAHGTIRILHAPSHPEAKGSDHIRKAISSLKENLKEKGYSIEFIEITGKSHAIVLEELTRCDFVVDQLYSDTPLAGFATEAAFFGKPAVVGGYYVRQIEQDFELPFIPPSLYCLPEEIEVAIERMITDTTFRLELGQKAQDFVETNWEAKCVAKKFLQIISGDIPLEWIYHPSRLAYCYGGGLSKERLQVLVKAVIDSGGVEALQLSDKPFLIRQLLELAHPPTKNDA